MIPRSNLFKTSNTRNQSAQGTSTTPNATPNKANTTCFSCGQKGHYANRCPSRRKSSTPTPAMPTPPPNYNGSSTPAQAQQNYAQGRVNQMSMEEAQNVPTVVPSTSQSIPFYLNRFLHSFLFCS
jgi:hypothetical protein